ncbi:MAG: serine/threonine-protein phosphatase [Frankiales bacterium]|nr:serine/threonine-protein phosphatase [Frankiales bacterium]
MLAPPALRRACEAVLLSLPRAVASLRSSPPAEGPALFCLLLLSVLIVVGRLVLGEQVVPSGAQIVPLLGGALLLRQRSMRQLIAVISVALAFDLVQAGLTVVRPGALITIAITALIGYEFSRSREETGLAGSSGDTFLVDLRDRLERQGELPPLPAGWHGEAVLRPAGGGPFAGDFVVSALTGDGSRLELALVDVSGKGIDAGTRALLLSGALGGLLGSLRPEEFLPAANRYLDRQQWDEGFATAVHLVVDLADGAYAVESAGHPPVAHFDAGSGRWRLLTAEGPALGLLPVATYAAETGRLDPGDALLLYTDGLVEVPGRDLEVGIDKLLGEAERLVPQGFAGGGELLVSRAAGDSTDDRGLVLLWRSR